MILSADVGYYDYNLMGDLEKKRKVIWYIKTSKNTDTFKPVRIGFDIGFGSLDENNNTVFVKTEYGLLKDMTFSSDNWFSMSPSANAEYFDAFIFDEGKPFWRIPVIYNMGSLLNNLPGLVHSIERGIYDIKHYDGKFDGTGDGLLGYTIYVLYSPNILAYTEIYQKIEDEEIKPIYKMGEDYLYPKKVQADSVDSVKNIQIYQYGPADKISVDARIFPNSDDVGRKGFIYVFIQ
jgi:hypothetical protein